jgi:hypothetical protein
MLSASQKRSSSYSMEEKSSKLCRANCGEEQNRPRQGFDPPPLNEPRTTKGYGAVSDPSSEWNGK